MESTRGQFSKVGSVHLHIGTHRNGSSLDQPLRELAARGIRTKVEGVLSFAQGPQRKNKPELYEELSNGFGTGEKLTSLGTIGIDDIPSIPEVVERVRNSLKDHQGACLELEKVVAAVDPRGEWSEEYSEVSDLHLPRFGRVGGSVVEIHHALDATSPRFDPKKVSTHMLSEISLGKIDHGGWSQFKKSDERVSYRSNAFTTVLQSQRKALEEHGILQEILEKELGTGTFTLRTIVERLIGFWKVGSR